MAVTNLVCTVLLAITLLLHSLAQARTPEVHSCGSWQSAHATFYGDADASGFMGILLSYALSCTMHSSFFVILRLYVADFLYFIFTFTLNHVLNWSGGACGYGNLFSQGYDQGRC